MSSVVDERRGLAEADLWPVVDRVLAPGRSVVDIVAHRLELPAVVRMRDCGIEVPEEFEAVEAEAAMKALLAPAVLDRVRQATDAQILLMKGPEVASYYPRPTLRGYTDLDLLVRDAATVQQALLDDGFEPVGDPRLYEGIHHLRPVALPGVPLYVEVHSRPKWFEKTGQPDVARLLAVAVPSAVPVPGLDALPPEYHALLLAAHSWAHEPFRRLRDILDVACVSAVCDAADLERLARELTMSRLWASTRRVVGAVLDDAPLPMPLRLWARNLVTASERTVLEGHLADWLSGFEVTPWTRAIVALHKPLRRELLPHAEPAPQKLLRSLHALRNARRRRSEHEAQVAHLIRHRLDDR